MRHVRLLMAAAVVLGGVVAFGPGANAESGPDYLWQIGAPDNNTAEFALGPGGFRAFKADPVYVVGTSSPDQDWPYIHPGPSDVWAGSQRHVFTIAFGLKAVPADGEARLIVDLVNTHYSGPPIFTVALNEYAAEFATPAGGTDDTLNGDFATAREHRFEAVIPAGQLREGVNVLTIASTSGSWALYDWVAFDAPASAELGPFEGATLVASARDGRALVKRGDALAQTVRVSVHRIGDPATIAMRVGDAAPVEAAIQPGINEIDLPVAPAGTETTVRAEFVCDGETIDARDIALRPVRQWTVYLLHHTHLDIGYTHVQTEVEQRQWEFLEQAIELGKATEDYPPEARFTWLPEGLWAVDSYLEQASRPERRAFAKAVKKGWISLDALYGNELTALCRPEELCQLVDCALRLNRTLGITTDSAMISDVPGYTWGIVPVLAQSGVRYFSIGPNVGHRIGYTRSAWSDQPFYWVSPSGEDKVLCWMAGQGYSAFHGRPLRDENQIFDYLNHLEETDFPFEIVQVRYNIGGDNGPPDPELPDYVRAWNEKYASPKLVIASCSEMFRAFEERYAAGIPLVSGDFTPYWEDGAASSARETAMNRAAAERLVQAQTLWTMIKPAEYPRQAFYEAWREALLYDEHTWGAHNSISEPECDFVKQQWAIKQAFAVEADRRSRDLLSGALRPCACNPIGAVDVFNTNSWPRTGLVTIPADWPIAGESVTDAANRLVPSQRLTTGELVFRAADVPALGAARFRIHRGGGSGAGAHAEALDVWNEHIRATIDPGTGAIASLESKNGVEYADVSSLAGLNHYLYVAGRDPASPQPNGPVTVTVKETGPLVASLLIVSDAPGCAKLEREIRAVAGQDALEIVNTLWKNNVYDKEAVHLAFPFHVPGGEVRMDLPWAIARPEADQLRGSCKNYFTAQRWVDVSNADHGITWAIPDAPLIEVGAITCDPIAVGWLEQIEPSTTLYSYVMNNYWETNYKASQDGPTTFRYLLRPHGPFDPAEAARFGIECGQPLVPSPIVVDAPAIAPPLSLAPDGVLITSIKPGPSQGTWAVRLFGASGRAESAAITLAGGKRPSIWLSDLREEKGQRIRGAIPVPPFGMVTVIVGQ